MAVLVVEVRIEVALRTRSLSLVVFQSGRWLIEGVLMTVLRLAMLSQLLHVSLRETALRPLLLVDLHLRYVLFDS